MGAVGTSLVALVVILGGGFVGMWLRQALPERHLVDETKDVVRVGSGLIGTISALVLGLLIAAANGSYGTQSGHVQHMTADIIFLDQLLAQYGPEAKPAREELRQAIDPLVKRIWRESRSGTANRQSFEAAGPGQDVAAIILQLEPRNEAQRIIKDRVVQTTADWAQTRLLLFEQSGSSLPLPFLVVLVFWLAMIFLSLGMFARPNPILIGALIICAVSASGALFLVLELSHPFTGLMQISSAPLRNALAPL
ncbi:MAG: DUF4239 domain-containing protein [Acidobacteria bacterium]|nr:DUF4239 domain-containing protein [Acidobacteriota bacterium]MBV9481252.1 DUF4239 domain-containing protein [Acidobacteriota bacterium]